MAVINPNKKRDDEIPTTGAFGYDVTGGGGGGGGGSPAGNARPKPQPAGYAAGAAIGDAVRHANATAYGAAGESNVAQGAAISGVTTPIRNFARGLFGAAPEAPAPPPVTRPQPALPAAPAPVSTGAPAASARPVPVTSVAPAVQATAPGGAVPAGGGSTSAPANDPNKVLGTFQGRTITQADSDRLSAKLPTANGPVAAGPNGSYVASTSGAAPAPAVAPAAANAGAPPAYGFSAPRPDTSRIRVADEARAKQISALQDQLRNIGPLNMRSKRDLAATLQAQITQLTGGQADLAESGSNTALDAATRVQTQGMGDAAQLAAAASAQQGEDRRAQAAQAGETYRSKYGDYLDTYRNERNVQAILATRPVAADTAQTKLQTELAASAQKFLEQVTPANKDGTYSPEQIAQAQASAQQLYAPQETPPVAGAQKAPDGNWYVPNPDGGYSLVKP